MTLIERLLKIATSYKQAAGIAQDTRLSRRVFEDSKKIGALREGGDLTTKRYEAAIRWFDANWPEGKERPDALSDHMSGDPSEVGEAA